MGGHDLIDQVHLCLSIPPRCSEANTVALQNGKPAIWIHRDYLGCQNNFTGFHSWARGCCVSTAGWDEQKVREYIRSQEEEKKRKEQLHFEKVISRPVAHRRASIKQHPLRAIAGLDTAVS